MSKRTVLIANIDGSQTVEQRETTDEEIKTQEEINAKLQIVELNSQLASSDYKVIKCAECSLAGLPDPYDIAALNTERQALRDQISALETIAKAKVVKRHRLRKA